MTYSEVKGDLFTAPNDCYFAHCISADYALGAGIAREFNRRYNMSYRLHRKYPFSDTGDCLLIDNVFNLVTKLRYYYKPTYDDFTKSLVELRKQCELLHITKLAMPRIGCGLDKLKWERVRDIIKSVFNESDISIVVYSLQRGAGI